jgi:hypothetical protein
MINVCKSKYCPFFWGMSSMLGVWVCEKFPNGIPHARIMGYDTCNFFEGMRPTKKEEKIMSNKICDSGVNTGHAAKKGNPIDNGV